MIRGGLFSRYFLEEGIRETDSYLALHPAEVLAFADDLRALWRRIEPFAKPSEDETENQFIYPALDRLGWHYFRQQTPGKGRQDVPTRCCS